MYLYIDGKIRIESFDQEILRKIRNYCTIENPQYRMAMAMAAKDSSKRKMLYAMPREFKYYKEVPGGIEVGRGMASVVHNILISNGYKDYPYTINRSSATMDNPLEEKIILRDYQIGRAEKVLAHKQGIIKLGTGWGKTPFAFKLAEITKLKTLIICCKSETSELHKYKSDFKKFYGKEIGVIQASTFDIKDVTVATASTLVQRDVDSIKNNFGMIIVDEAHVGMSDKRIEMLQKFNPERFYGMTGTPGRANGQGKAMEFYYGNIIIDEKLPQDRPSVKIYRTDTPLIGSEYYEMEEEAVNNTGRNNQIIEIIKNTVADGRKMLVLTKRIEHGKVIESMLGGYKNIRAIALSSNDQSKMRNELIQALRTQDKQFDVLIGTYGLFSTGIDIEILDTVMLAMSIKVDGDYDATLIQSIGRCLRLYKGKQTPLVIDLDDNKNKIMHRHHLSRKQVYEREGWDYIVINR